ncbi:MAG: hypothetical protein FWC00_00480 [Firmicutes bacterium]|nr:hypothetical protein [Bacillota bacterium]
METKDKEQTVADEFSEEKRKAARQNIIVGHLELIVQNVNVCLSRITGDKFVKEKKE